MAYLLEGSGEGALVASIASTNNQVRVRDLRGHHLVDWLHREGLTKAEAARIQPEYDPRLDLSIMVIVLYAVLLPLQIAVGALAFRFLRARPWAEWARLGARLASVGVAVAIGMIFVVSYSSTYGAPFAPVFRAALVVAFAVPLVPLEAAGTWLARRVFRAQEGKRIAFEVLLTFLNVTFVVVLSSQTVWLLANAWGPGGQFV
ncbi:MAG: hypothetical protein ACT4OI_08460 [Methanobacteriota archaeon]